MKLSNIFLLLMILTLFIPMFVPVASAAETNVTEGMGITCKGPYGIAVPLGIERFVPLEQARVYYNWISIAILFAIGALASSRTTRFMALLVPIMAAILIFFGWLTNANSAHPEQLWGVVVIAAVLAVMVYMKGSLHEKFGIAGPGSMMFNIVFYILILQSVVGFVNSTAIWDTNAVMDQSSSFTNIDLDKEVNSISNTGGVGNDLTQLGSMLLDLTLGVIRMFISMGLALIGFSAVLAILFPWLWNSAYGPAFLIILQLGIYMIYYMAYMRFMYKPLGEGDF
jgi:hypothetical protein